jgi:class 3 adenylate cyclase
MLTGLTALWYFQNKGAISRMADETEETIDVLHHSYLRHTDTLIESLHAQSTQIQEDIIDDIMYQPLTIIRQNANLLNTSGGVGTQLSLDFTLKWMWLQLSQQFHLVEGISFADPSGLYVEFERDAQRAGLINQSELTYTLEFAPPIGWTDSMREAWCPQFCPIGEDVPSGMVPGQTYQFRVDPAYGTASSLRENYSYNATEQAPYKRAEEANGVLAWYGPYVTTSVPKSISMRATQALLGENGDVKVVLNSDVTLDYLTARLMNLSETPGQEGTIFIMDYNGYMVAHSNGLDAVVKFENGTATEHFIRANESACALTRKVAAHILEDGITDSDQLTAGNISNGDPSNDIIFTDKFFLLGDDEFGIQWVLVHAQYLKYYRDPIQKNISKAENDRRDDTGRIMNDLQNQVLLVSFGTWLVSVMLGMVILSMVSQQITRPLNQIRKDMRLFAKFDADAIDSMVAVRSDTAKGKMQRKRSFVHPLELLRYIMGKSPGRTRYHNIMIREIAEICDSFSYMAAGLQSFARYMDAHLVQILVRSKRQAQLGMAPADVTIFFSDLVGFTTMAESMDTAILMDVLGTYLEEMSNVVMNYGGVVGEFIGDAIMAWWNAPPLEYGEGHGEAAVAAAIRQQERLRELNAMWKERGLHELSMRMGLARGRVLSGNLGSRKRMKYGLVGDSVNLASRLEGLCKRYGVASLCEENVHLSLGVAERFHLRPIDLVTVKGRTQPTELFELVGRRTPPENEGEEPSEASVFCELFKQANTHFREQDFANALAVLDIFQARWPHDQPAHLLRSRCMELLAKPPGPDWSPVTHLTEK